MRNILFLLSLLVFVGHSMAQTHYPAASIPQNLLKNADLVVRLHELKFMVLNKGEAIETEHMVMTLLNENAVEFSEPSFYYYKFEKIEDIEASVYDAAGNLVRNLKKKDIEDGKPAEYYVNDFRFKSLKLPSRSYPYTIEYTVVKKYDGLMFYPSYNPQPMPSASVEYAKFELLMPQGLEARFKEINIPANSKTGDLRWEFKGIEAFRPEPFAPLDQSGIPEVITAPTEFSFGGEDGDMRTWESYGKFLYKLMESQTKVPVELKSTLKEMVADCPDMECKIRRVYEYLQSNTRYFYVGMGIGGWQPAPVSKVDQYKYGDCKGLSNYMSAMLNALDVPAFYTVIRAREEEQMAQYPDFPNGSFNHAIVCVPMEKDTFWLECTSQTETCGYLGDFTDNRPALLVTPNGGKLLQTPRYDETKNSINRKTQIVLLPDGSATLHSKDVYTGIPQAFPSFLEGQSDELRKKYFYQALNVNDFEIKSLVFVRHKDRLPSVEQNLELALPRLASASGKRLFLPINLLSTKLKIPVVEGERKSGVQADSRGYTEEDFVTISIPDGFQLESQFSPITVASAFGSFELSVTAEAGKLAVKRKLVLNASIQPKEAFPDFLAFLKNISKADKSKLVLVNGGTKP